MKRNPLLAGAAIGMAALLGLTACSSDRGGSSESGGEEKFAKITEGDLVVSLPAGEKEVDEVTWSIVEGEPATLNPALSATLIIPNLCDNLLSLQPDFSVAPGIAKKAEYVDPVTFVIDIRDDVTFWDGTPVTADDVVYSLELGQNPESQWYGAFVLVKDIEKTGDHQVTVHFEAPDAEFPNAIAGQGGAVMSKAFGEKVGQDLGSSEAGLMCSGPYKLDAADWKPGSEIVTTANEDYWGGAPKVKTLKYVFVTDTSTLTTALTQGEIDGAHNVAPASRASFEGEGAGTLYLGPSTASYSFGPATSEGPAANPKVRLALSYAIDREKYINTVLNGLGEVQKTIVPQFTFNKLEAHDIFQQGYDALEAPELNLDRAKELLEESGEDLSQPLVVAVPAGAKEFQQTAQIMQASAKQIGLTIEINEMQPADFGAIFYDPAGRDGVDFVATQGYLETPGVIGYPSLFLLPADQGGIFNWSEYDNPEVTQHMQAARTAVDEETSAREFVAAQQIFAPDQLQVTLAGAYHATYLSDDLTGIVTSVAAYSSPWALELGGK